MKEFTIDDEYRLKRDEKAGDWTYFRNGKPIPKKVEKAFKFYSLNLNNIDALLNSYFYLSNPITFNDPFDCNFNLVDNHDDKEGINNMTTVKRNNYGNLGIVSMTSVVNNHLMWAHYTDNYQGFALEWKGTEVTTLPNEGQFSRATFAPVIYPKKLIRIKKEYPFALHYVMTTKLKHWEYEDEWRFICELGPERDRILYYDRDKVKAIYVGHQLVDENKSAYRLILGIHATLYPKIPVYVVYPHTEKLELTFEKVLPK
ncbi:DUF2971 domain-containing protein [Maribacter aestuarii]|uniref:DUF2971 domain-containing protein n=1 Tax=Maribacter aestuarii TaxID=1130723 RepID=UPI00248BC16F|nr:DUF2971 domain-containing protein [Maribacter aestuarii]